METNLHMLDFLDTVVLGEEGGVWYDQVQSELFRSTITWRNKTWNLVITT